MHFAGDHALGLNFHAAFSKNNAVIAAGYHHAVAFDLAFDFGVLAEDQSLLGNNISLHIAVNAESPRDLQSAFHRYALINKSSPLFAAAAG